MKLINKTILYSLPTSIFFTISINADLIMKYGVDYANPIIALLLLWCLSTCFIGLPIYLALSSETKYKSYIILLSVLCFLPFGKILYLVALIWAIIAKATQTSAKTETHK